MYRNLLLCLCLLLALLGTAMAEDKDNGSVAKEQAKELSGMSIIGNEEAPKSLYIVPWKSSEIGVETGMNMMLDESDTPVDRDVFMRQMDFYELSTKK
jgi:hypothetical protein